MQNQKQNLKQNNDDAVEKILYFYIISKTVRQLSWRQS